VEILRQKGTLQEVQMLCGAQMALQDRTKVGWHSGAQPAVCRVLHHTAGRAINGRAKMSCFALVIC